MSAAVVDPEWAGTSDSPATIRARAAISAADRMAWLDEAIELAAATGALAAERAGRARAAQRWWAEAPTTALPHDDSDN